MSAPEKPKKTLLTHLIAGGGAGAVESVICHPLDTIKTRLQLQRSVGRSIGPVGTAQKIVRVEGFFALYKGLTAVACGIVPKMAIRFSSFEYYKKLLADPQTKKVSVQATFFAGLLSGVTEAVCVVTPFEVLKIRLQAQRHSLSEPNSPLRRYRGVLHVLVCVVREEGPTALYKGLVPTVLRQATNQAVNFTAYQELKKLWIVQSEVSELQPWQHLLLGGLSGAMGPLANSPIDVIKTRLQKQRTVKGQAPVYNGALGCMSTMFREEGIRAFYKGLTPRLMRIAPGQAITFMMYEFLATQLYSFQNPPPALQS